MTCLDDNVLALLASANRITPAERNEIDRHLDRCAECAGIVTELARTVSPPAPTQRYELVRRIGAGSMGEVWEAHDRALDRSVALKLVRPDAVEDAGRRSRLRREARALARLRHDHVVAVHDIGTLADGQLFIAMQLVDGDNARDWQHGAPRSAHEIEQLWRGAANGLAAVHQAGIVHRDLKPENVLVARDGTPLIADFGLARDDQSDTQALTATGLVVGTPRYLAPECLLGARGTAQADQFSLCVCIWEALTGERPFAGATHAALALAMLRPPRLPSTADRAVFAVLVRGLAYDPARRWPDVGALTAALDAAFESRAARSEPRWRPPIIVLAALAAGAMSSPREAAPSAPAIVVVAAPAASVAPVETPIAPIAHPPTAAPAVHPRPRAVAVARAAPPSHDAYAGRRWSYALTRAREAFAAGDPVQCAALLEASPRADEPDSVLVVENEELLRRRCLMASGKCERAIEAWEAFLEADDHDGGIRRLHLRDPVDPRCRDRDL